MNKTRTYQNRPLLILHLRYFDTRIYQYITTFDVVVVVVVVTVGKGSGLLLNPFKLNP